MTTTRQGALTTTSTTAAVVLGFAFCLGVTTDHVAFTARRAAPPGVAMANVGPSPAAAIALTAPTRVPVNDAYLAALSGGGWEGLLAAGRAYLDGGNGAPADAARRTRTRELYAAALVRAQAQQSFDGVLRVAEAFAAIGDREDVEHSLRSAERLVAWSGRSDGPRRLTAFRARWSAGLFGPLEP